MNILLINSTYNQKNTNFNGKIITIGNGWNSKIKNTFRFNPEIINLAQGEHDVIGKLYSKKASSFDLNHSQGEPVFRLDLMIGNSKFGFINKIKAALGLLPKVKLIKDYHCEESFLDKLQKRPDVEILKDKFGINK